jgi:type IV secretory pathway VirJ component
MPEVERLRLPVLCLWGEGDRSALCPELPPAHATMARIGSGHHLGGEYEQIAARILSFPTPAGAQP